MYRPPGPAASESDSRSGDRGGYSAASNTTSLPRELLQQRRQDVLLVAPDEPVTPVGRSARREEILHPVTVGGGLVHSLHRLERKRDAGRGHLPPLSVVLAVP